jgi:hypothetical protein
MYGQANPNCGYCWDGHLPKTAALCGVSYPQFFEMIMQSALARKERAEKVREEDKSKKFVIVGRNGAEQLFAQPPGQ